MRAFVLVTTIAAVTVPPPSAPPQVLTFLERCGEAGKRLWGRSLCAPVVIVDPKTGQYRTTATPPSAALPSTRANTAFDWGGEKWIMVLEPLPSDSGALDALLFHEAFHVHQSALGLPANNSLADHLGTAQGRYLIRLEWKALGAALRASGAAQRSHIAQALAFRATRLAHDPKAAESERLQMRHEGLANYTGAALTFQPQAFALKELEGGPKRPSLARSFAYVSGPAWGLLLDRFQPGWRLRLKSGLDLPDMVGVRPASVARADDYGGGAILAEETAAASVREASIRRAVAETAENRGLKLPLSQMQMNFDPNQVLTAPDGSPLYPKISLSDRWGRIEVDGFPLRMKSDYTAAYVRWPLAPADKLELAPGWRVEAVPGGGAILVEPSR